MKSYVNDYAEKKDITVPKKYYEIKIQSWEKIFGPTLEEVKKQYQAITGEVVEGELTDEVVARLGIAGLESVAALKAFLRKDYEEELRRYHFYQSLMPYLLAFHAETAQAVINQEEFNSFYEEYLEQIEEFAEQEGLVLEDYAQLKLGLRGDVHLHLKDRAREDFVFKLIARERYLTKEEVTQADYEAYIQEQVLAGGVDEIELKEQLSYSNFAARRPEMFYTNELYEYFAPQLEIETD